MQQWEQGKVVLDTPIADYLPWSRLAGDPRESVPDPGAAGIEDTWPSIRAYGHTGIRAYRLIAMAGRWLWALEADATRPQLKLFDPAGPAPAVGFSASVVDLAKFVGWAFRLARTGQPEVLRALTLREMLRVHYVSSDWGTNRRRRLSATLFVSGGVRFSP